MTRKQKLIVQATFEHIQSGLPMVTDRFYSRLFRKNESLRTLFKNSQHKQVGEFSVALAEVIRRLDNPDDLNSYLRVLGDRHQPYRLADKHFIEVGKAFVFAIRHSLGTTFNRNVANAWTAFFKEMGRKMDRSN